MIVLSVSSTTIFIVHAQRDEPYMRNDAGLNYPAKADKQSVDTNRMTPSIIGNGKPQSLAVSKN